jgi:hypothetical protein
LEKKKPRSFVRKPRPERSKAVPEQSEPFQAPDQAESSSPPQPTHDEQRDAERARIVVPRQARGDTAPSGLDVELREVRYGETARTPYLRVVPRQRRFTRVAEGHIEATSLGSRPQRGIDRVLASARQAVLGGPLAASQAINERLTKVKALAVIGSDPLSSSTYATEEALVVLSLAGSAALI